MEIQTKENITVINPESNSIYPSFSPTEPLSPLKTSGQWNLTYLISHNAYMISVWYMELCPFVEVFNTEWSFLDCLSFDYIVLTSGFDPIDRLTMIMIYLGTLSKRSCLKLKQSNYYIFLQYVGVNLWYFKLRWLNPTEMIVWNM